MTGPDTVVFLLDVDNTLLDNDHIVTDRGHHLTYEFGHESLDRYWDSFEGLRNDLDYEDYLWAFQRDRVETMDDPHGHTSLGRMLNRTFHQITMTGVLFTVLF